MPGKTCESISFAYFSLHMISRRAGRAGSIVVVVTNPRAPRAGMEAVATRPAMCAIVRQEIRADFRAIRHTLKIHDARGRALAPR